MTQEPLRLIRRFPLFDLWLERWDKDNPCEMQVYRNKHGSMIDCKHGRRRPGLVRLIDREGIRAVKSNSRHCCCSIGKGANGRWYGWSHRAIVSFGPGDRIFEERYGDDETLFRLHGQRTIRTDADARLAAKRFAAYVS